ncbi:unnamed protein product [marine sediment metagenome]|uniref:Uncharacterized protein n=1 Tax=marine sediment metagenome TaxID=412755 RepID=X0UIF8_9ZZZZ
MIPCPYCKHSEGADFLRIKEIESEDMYGDTRTIIIFGCPKCKGIFFEYEYLL